MDWISLGLAAAVAAVISGVGVWLMGVFGRQNLKARIAALETELAGLRNAAAERDTALKTAGEARENLAAAQGRLEEAAKQLVELQDARKKIFDLSREGAALRANLENAQQAHAEQVRQLTELRQEVQDQFKLLAGDVLKSSREDFMAQATQLFESQKQLTSAEIDKRTKDISDLVAPLGKSLESYQVALAEIEKARATSYGGINQALDAVRIQHDEVKQVTSNLVSALKASPKTRGRWGEETLRRVMELSGMVEHCDFETEKHYRGEDETLRPDALIHVSGGRSIIVDAKAPVTAYLEAIGAETEEQRDLLLQRHAKQLRERLTNLSSKSYWERFDGSPDCVVMFVPGDNFVSAAFERDPDLFEEGIKARVLICTPTTFIALAKAISYGWRQERLAENALEVAKLGKELYARLATLGTHISDMGKHLNNATKKFNLFVGSLESSVMPQARRFNDLGVEGTSEPLPELASADTVVRFPQSGRDLLFSDSND
jgi:DNA recombination protein RmuC